MGKKHGKCALAHHHSGSTHAAEYYVSVGPKQPHRRHGKERKRRKVAERAEATQRGELDPQFLARAGRHLVTESENELRSNEMPAASLLSNIGGMGVHWTCACPRPGNEERIPFIPANEMDAALDKAQLLLNVLQHDSGASHRRSHHGRSGSG